MIRLTLVAASGLLFGLCGGISQRTIYTLFTVSKTWNEAKVICEGQHGQLVKIKGQMQIEELDYLFHNAEEMMNVLTVINLWTSMHKPFTNSTWTHQDCEPSDAGFAPSSGSSTDKCAYIGSAYSINSANCGVKRIFMCQRNEGECWYEPYFEEQPSPFDSNFPVYNATDPAICALACRNFYDAGTGSECWGFTHYPDNALCLLHGDSTPAASSKFLNPLNRLQGLTGSTFYIRRCFEGTVDTGTYDSIQNNNPEPETNCSTTPYIRTDSAPQVCYCTTKEHPPIPEPTSSEEKAKQYEKELIIDSANTSAALRKLTSAEDNRPSAVGVGFLGVGLLTAVFGGLFLLDLNVLLSGVKSLICSSGNTMDLTETDC